MCYDQAFATDELAEQRSKAAWEFPEHNKNWLEFFRAGQVPAGTAELVAALQKSTVPALIIHGRDDRTVHYEASLRLVSILPNSRMVLLNHCGHWAQLEYAEEFNRMVDDFITHN
jgi:2-hydroxy-6-oxonona-2,4-dienedioate hydrolase